MKFKYSFYVRPCDINFEKAKAHSILKYLSKQVTYDEAFRLYYEVKDSIITWDFDFDPITLKETKKGYSVVGDGVKLGTLVKEQRPEGQADGLTIKTIIDELYIYSLHCFVTYGKYFRVPEADYLRYVEDDPYRRGFARWASNDGPRQVILDIECGDKKLTRAEEYLRAKQAALK